MPRARKPANPRKLLNKAMGLIEKDLKQMASKEVRSPQEMSAISRYCRDLQAIAAAEESEELKAQRELKKLSEDELNQAIQDLLKVQVQPEAPEESE